MKAMNKWVIVAAVDTLLIAVVALGFYSPAFFYLLNKSPLYLSLSAVNLLGVWTIIYLKYTGQKISKLSSFILLILIIPALVPLLITLVFALWLIYLSATGQTYIGG